MKRSKSLTFTSRRVLSELLIIVALSLLAGCASVPPQIAQLQQKEQEIIISLQASHNAMIDAYVDQKLLVFETFFFNEYGPAYLKSWRKNFMNLKGRAYNEGKDFNVLYSDLVVEYQEQARPIEKIRKDLHDAIAREYAHALAAHQAITIWIQSLEKLNASERESFDKLLGAIKPGLSLDVVDKTIEDCKQKVKARIKELTV